MPQEVQDALKIVQEFNENGTGMITIWINGEPYPEREPFVAAAHKLIHEYFTQRGEFYGAYL